MLKFFLVAIPLFALTPARGQSAVTKQHVDSLVAVIDRNYLLEVFTLVDSTSLSAQTQKCKIYAYKKLLSTGGIQKIEQVGNGTCDSREQFYFVNGKLIKIVVKLRCEGLIVWDSDLYFDSDIVFAQRDKATELNGPAFLKPAYDALKRVTEFDAEKRLR